MTDGTNIQINAKEASFNAELDGQTPNIYKKKKSSKQLQWTSDEESDSDDGDDDMRQHFPCPCWKSSSLLWRWRAVDPESNMMVLIYETHSTHVRTHSYVQTNQGWVGKIKSNRVCAVFWISSFGDGGPATNLIIHNKCHN